MNMPINCFYWSVEPVHAILYISQREARVAKARKRTVVFNDLRTYHTAKFAAQLDFPHLLSIHV